mmetsp:Transcript_2483/g.8322  ORF Transcript_2483/g.8322 Transcript_2483/m.8322 type:complete len:329 (-) Transcript_2483:92-1078(-)
MGKPKIRHLPNHRLPHGLPLPHLGAPDKLPLIQYCASPRTMLNHHTRLLRPDLTSCASHAADDAVAEAVAHAVAISPECYHPSHPSFARARLHLPITSTTATSCDGGGAGIPSLHSTRTPAFLASFIDTLPLLTLNPHLAPALSDPTTFAASPSPTLRAVATAFTLITSDPYFHDLSLDPSRSSIYKALTDDPSDPDLPRIPSIARLHTAANQHAQRALTLVSHRRYATQIYSNPNLPQRLRAAMVQAGQTGAGIHIYILGSDRSLRLTDHEYKERSLVVQVHPPSLHRPPLSPHLRTGLHISRPPLPLLRPHPAPLPRWLAPPSLRG